MIKDSFAYLLLFSGAFHLFTPEYVFTELERHKEEILETTESTEEEFCRLSDKRPVLFKFRIFSTEWLA
ncbi:hypothetical protein HY486_03885 [Candidatus Woesearchaeota archaeon]|nr:hypothetical protein [Candidatus Woesearchaeota archaeon]